MRDQNKDSTVDDVKSSTNNNSSVVLKRVKRLGHLGEDVTDFDFNGDCIHRRSSPWRRDPRFTNKK
ncbi:MAG: hypothetical protein R3B60_01460 [Candidatus Paceibacterota bacterium]